jgi:tetratricopeptide (TPR) repeat protein
MKPLARSSAGLDPVALKVREIGALIEKDEGAEAERMGLALLKLHPGRPDVHNIMGVVYIKLKRRSKAVPHFETAVKAEPNNPVYLNNLGRLYLDLDLLELALPPLYRALAINPKLSETLWAIGEYYRESGKAEKGLPFLDRGLRIRPDDYRIRDSRATSLETLGRADEAKAVFGSLLNVRSCAPRALYRLSQLAKLKTDSPLFAKTQDLLESPDLDDSFRSVLYSALAHFYENSGDTAHAFECFEQANVIQKLTFDIAAYRTWIDRIINVFTADFFAQWRDVGHASDLPVFVVGMPRSGTTLTEQIIASHPQAGGAGELNRLRRFAERYGYRKDPGTVARNLSALGQKGIAELAENVLGLLKFHAPNASRIVDKMPHNFETLGFIALLFPKARVIHCVRNPADNCWSCYQNRLSKGHPYAKDLTTLGLYYREYVRLMEHWRRVLPMPIHESRYEDMTSNPEQSVRNILGFLGLPWDPACLDFHKSEATVSTISHHQVRQPVYRSSVERWRRYEKQLAPLIEALGDCMPAATESALS